MEKITRKNPESMPKPVGNYSHITRVPKGAGLFVTSGQVGTDGWADTIKLKRPSNKYI